MTQPYVVMGNVKTSMANTSVSVNVGIRYWTDRKNVLVSVFSNL